MLATVLITLAFSVVSAIAGIIFGYSHAATNIERLNNKEIESIRKSYEDRETELKKSLTSSKDRGSEESKLSLYLSGTEAINTIIFHSIDEESITLSQDMYGKFVEMMSLWDKIYANDLVVKDIEEIVNVHLGEIARMMKNMDLEVLKVERDATVGSIRVICDFLQKTINHVHDDSIALLSSKNAEISMNYGDVHRVSINPSVLEEIEKSASSDKKYRQ